MRDGRVLYDSVMRDGRSSGRDATPRGNDDGGQAIVDGAPVSTGREARMTKVGDYRCFAGWRSDPFFIDRQGVFFNGFQFTRDDFFADKNVCSIVLEIPNSALGPKQVSLWHRTLMPSEGTGGGWVQVERAARPLQLMLVFAATVGAPQSLISARCRDGGHSSTTEGARCRSQSRSSTRTDFSRGSE